MQARTHTHTHTRPAVLPCRQPHTFPPSSHPRVHRHAQTEDADLPDGRADSPWLLGALPVHKPRLATILWLATAHSALHGGPSGTTDNQRQFGSTPSLVEATLAGVPRGPPVRKPCGFFSAGPPAPLRHLMLPLSPSSPFSSSPSPPPSSLSLSFFKRQYHLLDGPRPVESRLPSCSQSLQSSKVSGNSRPACWIVPWYLSPPLDSSQPGVWGHH